MEKYKWRDIKSNGAKNPRARKTKRISNMEYLDQIDHRDNLRSLNNLGSDFSNKEFNSNEDED